MTTDRASVLEGLHPNTFSPGLNFDFNHEAQPYENTWYILRKGLTKLGI